MEYRRINKMTRAERAKQFAPFSPLSGFHKALLKAERKLVYSKNVLVPDDTPVSAQNIPSLNVSGKRPFR